MRASGGVLLRSLLVAALLPLVVVFTSGTARAATLVGEPATGRFETDSVASTRCELVGYWVVVDQASYTIKVKGDCFQDWQADLAGATIGSVTASGDGCSLMGGPVEGDPETAWALTLTPSVGDVATCNIDTGEAHVCSDMFIGGVSCSEHVFPWLIGPPPTEEEDPIVGCPRGVPSGRPSVELTTPSGGYQHLVVTATTDNDSAHDTSWIAVVWVRENGGPPGILWSSSSWAVPAGAQGFEKTWTVGPLSHVAGRELIGVQLVAANGGGHLDGWNNGLGWTFQNIITTGPPDTDLGAATWPERCTWYWGEQIGSSTEGYHQPLGPLTGSGVPDEEEPDVEPAEPPATSGCESFDITSPSGWADWGLCALADLLRSAIGILGGIWDTLGEAVSILGQLPELIADAFAALFVPSDGFMESKADQIKAAWSDSAPMVFLDGLQDVGSAFVIGNPGSGCQGPELAFDVPIGDAGGVQLHPLSTCGAMATLATLVRAALTVVVYIGGFLAAVRIVGASFGIDVSFGRGAEA